MKSPYIPNVHTLEKGVVIIPYETMEPSGIALGEISPRNVLFLACIPCLDTSLEKVLLYV